MHTQEDFKFIHTCFSKDYDAQRKARDPDVYPGWMPDEAVEQMPMTFMMTGEFEYCRRDAFAFARRLMKYDKLAGISDVAGVGHDWSFIGCIPRIESFYTEWKNAFEAYTSA